MLNGGWIDRALRRVALAAIRTYQRHLSPRKGFCCAYRVHTGRAGCSALGLRAIRRHGVAAGIAILRERLFLCGVTHRRHAPTMNNARRPRPPLRQRGDCDPGCDLPCDGDSGCGGSGGKGFSCLCDVLDCGDCGNCDWSRRDPRQERRRKGRKERDAHIPPQRSPRPVTGPAGMGERDQRAGKP